MAGNADFINILREIRGSAAPGETATDGIWYELTQADTNGNAGIYGDILAKISEASVLGENVEELKAKYKDVLAARAVSRTKA